MNIKQESFIERINSKQRDAFHELFREFFQALVMYAMKYVSTQEEAEDIVQDIFVSVWEKEEKFLSYQSFRVFLYRSLRNTCLNVVKHKLVEKKYATYQETYAEIGEEEEYDWVQEEIYRELFKVIDELPPRCREVFLLSLDGLKNEEIAARLHITLLTVKTQKKKALRYLRERMGKYMFALFCLLFWDFLFFVIFLTLAYLFFFP